VNDSEIPNRSPRAFHQIVAQLFENTTKITPVVWVTTCRVEVVPRSKVGRDDTHIHIEIIRQFANHLPAEHLFADKDFGDGRLGDPCLSAQLGLLDVLCFQQVTEHVGV
jgi:hypothetical protein